jgi:hypothetical protein
MAIELGNGSCWGRQDTRRGIKLILRIILGLVILSFSCLANAQNPTGTVMHRSGAGQFDSTGWTDAKSTEGKFSVRLPVPFDDFTVKNSDEGLQAGQFFVIGATTPEGVRFSVTRASYDNPVSAEHYFRNWQTGGVLRGKQEDHRVTKYRGFDAVEISASDDFSIVYARTILVKRNLLLQTIESPLSQRAAAEQLKATFFQSLSFEP